MHQPKPRAPSQPPRLDAEGLVQKLFITATRRSALSLLGAPSVASKRKKKKEAYPPAGTSLQVQTDKHNSPCKEIPAGMYLQARCAESRLSALGLCRWNTPSLRKRGDCREDGLLHSLERFIEKIRPKEKAEKKKGWKKLLADAAFYSISSVLLRLKPLAQRDDLCDQIHVVYPGSYSAALYLQSLPVERRLK